MTITSQSLPTKYLLATVTQQYLQKTLSSATDLCSMQHQQLCSVKCQFQFLDLHHTLFHSTTWSLLKSKHSTQEDGQSFQTQILLEKESRLLQLTCHYLPVMIRLTQHKLLLFGMQYLLLPMETLMLCHTA